MQRLLGVLARRRTAGTGLALVCELLLLAGLALAPAATTLGLPAAVAAAIAGTVAVVFGVVDGVVVATAGAIAFAALSGWGAGQLAAIGVWPLIVAAVGLFARRVERQRRSLRRLVDAEEEHRRSLALTLHEDSAQTLTGALLTLRTVQADEGIATDRARELIKSTIQQLRALALELSPKALDDYGLPAALAHLAETETGRSGRGVRFTSDWDGRLPREIERALFRVAQTALDAALTLPARSVEMALAVARGRAALTVTVAGPEAPLAAVPLLPATVTERLALLGGRVDTQRRPDGRLVLRADVPVDLRLLEHVARLS
jgi:signal transduction histidine kinase